MLLEKKKEMLLERNKQNKDQFGSIYDSSVLAWRIPGMGEPGGLPSRGCTELDTTDLAAA